MPILESAKKYIKVTEKKTAFNRKRKKEMKNAIREVMDLIKEGKKDEASKSFIKAQKFIDKAVKKGVIKENTGARRKSSLVKKIKQLG
ncbi:MAG: 30S ribosomal protein S20 [Candidatus Moraniibacteriota bacterium]